MKILILGITGRTGMLAAEEAVKRGHTVSGIARNPAKFTIQGAGIIEGTPYDIETVRRAMEGCEAVVSTLNLFPSSQGIFSKITTPLDTMSVSMRNVVSVMKERGIRRVVLMTAMGVGDSASSLPAIFRVIMRLSIIKYSYADHERQEKVLENSGLDWTVVRPVGLNDKNDNLSVLADTTHRGLLNRMISRNAVAHFILDCIEKGQYLGEKPGISNA
jgi:putative NADH-flavin reductase